MRLVPALLSCLAAAFCLPAVASDLRTVSGQIMVLERMALPDDTTIIVDLSTIDDEGLIAARRASEGLQSPFDFAVEVPQNMPLILRVGLRAQDEMLWLSEPVPIAAETQSLDLGPIRAVRIPPMGYASVLACGNTLVELGILPDVMRVRLNEQIITLTPQPAASGALFVDPDNAATSIHMKDDTAVLRIDGAELSACRLFRPAADFTQGVWNIGAIQATPTLFPSRTELVFYPDGRMSATVGCNRMIGGFRRHGGIVSFGRIASTMMACADGLSEQEAKFNAVLPTIDGYMLDAGAGRLTLMSKGNPVIQARK